MQALTTAGAGAPPPPDLADDGLADDVRALALTIARHDATREKYIRDGWREPGEARWLPGSLHLTYHESIDSVSRALVAFERKHGFVPELG